MALISKWDTTTNRRSYILYYDSDDDLIKFAVTNLGTAVDRKIVESNHTVVRGKWFFVAGRYRPGNDIAIFVNGIKVSNNVNIPTSLYSGAASFLIGAQDEGGADELLHGGSSLDFLCAAALPDGAINGLYQHTRAMFGQ